MCVVHTLASRKLDIWQRQLALMLEKQRDEEKEERIEEEK